MPGRSFGCLLWLTSLVLMKTLSLLVTAQVLFAAWDCWKSMNLLYFHWHSARHKVKGAVVVSAYTTHMDDPVEKKSGYFDRPWVGGNHYRSNFVQLWNDMKQNAEWIIQFHSRSDHLVPISEGRLVAKELGTIYHETENDGHFQDPVYPSFLKAIQEKLNKWGGILFLQNAVEVCGVP